MGIGGSFPHKDDGELSGRNPGVVKRIPIEVKPRRTLGGTLRTVGSFAKRQKGGSLRSAMSVDMYSSEADKVRRDFEMFKISKQNEMSDLIKKEKKLENENHRLRAELQAMQKTCNKLRQERDVAVDAKYQALERAATFEQDRNKVQRQFKIFRETKESEIRDLLKARRNLEATLNRSVPTSEKNGENGVAHSLDGGSPQHGDWWSVLESEPSHDSMSQLQTLPRAHECFPSLTDIDCTLTSLNRGEESPASTVVWNQVMLNLPQTAQYNVIRVYLSAPENMKTEVDILKKNFVPKLRELCELEGRFLTVIHLPSFEDTDCTEEEVFKMNTVRHRLVQDCGVFLAFLGNQINSFTCSEYELGHLNNPGARSAVFCFSNLAVKGDKLLEGNARELIARVNTTGCAKIINGYDEPKDGAKRAFTELKKLIQLELGIDDTSVEPQRKFVQTELDTSYEDLCASCQWDMHSDGEQLELFNTAVGSSSCELGLEEHYERLNEHVAAAGPLPPFLVSGVPGSGKSLLLAKWISLQQRRNPSSLVLYHFAGSPVSCSADVISMVRRLTCQLMQYIASPPSPPCEASRLLDEFPKWLEKISSRLPGGIILVIDSLDRMQNAENHLQWLLDPLPVDIRVIVTANPEGGLLAWRSWPTLHLEPLAPYLTKDLIHCLNQERNFPLTGEQEALLMSDCRTPASRLPLYVTVLVDQSVQSTSSHGTVADAALESCLRHCDTTELYRYVLESLEGQFENSTCRGLVKQVCQFIYVSRNGISESELFHLIPELTWAIWAPLCYAFLDRHVLTFTAGALTFAYEQVREAVRLNYCLDGNEQGLAAATHCLIGHYSLLLRPGSVTARIADELPFLIQSIGDHKRLRACLANVCIFRLLYTRGRCSELLDFWGSLGVDKQGMATVYFETIKKVEEGN